MFKLYYGKVEREAFKRTGTGGRVYHASPRAVPDKVYQTYNYIMYTHKMITVYCCARLQKRIKIQTLRPRAVSSGKCIGDEVFVENYFSSTHITSCSAFLLRFAGRSATVRKSRRVRKSKEQQSAVVVSCCLDWIPVKNRLYNGT